MFNLIQADLFKLYKSKAIKVLFAMTILSAVAMAVIAHLISKGKLDVGMSGIGFMFSDVNMISILGAVMAGVFICGDFDNKTINSAIAAGCSRGTIIISKAVVFFCAIALILLPYVIITIVGLFIGSDFNMGSIAIGFMGILTSDSNVGFSTSDIWKLLAIAFTLIIVYLSQLSICVPLAFMLKKPVSVVGIYYGITIFFAQMAGLREKYEVINRIFACTPYGRDYSIIMLNSSSGDMIKAIYVSLIFIIVMIAVTYSTFRKVEIK